VPGIALLVMVLVAGIWTAAGDGHPAARSLSPTPSAHYGGLLPAPHQAKPLLGTSSTLGSTTTTATTQTTAPSSGASTLSAGGPGALPQTAQFPPSDSSGFRSEMQALWQGIKSDSLPAALPAFFPEAAYLQVKAVPDPGADYLNRLLIDFQLDVGAAHQLLGKQASSATLVAVSVPSEQANWIAPGDCYNKIGYFQVSGSRLVYRVDGQVRSFIVASLISWRGVWYVVHLGAITRSSETGLVDDPTLGPGTFGPPGGC
jgi:hypothetical protein